ncbi:serine hydrolase [Paenibacillus sp. PR3]|uniref:Serine hydrolase n=1 Tax=Paenibacillus terricola TaxID=2763503 RepID=A0ABR8MXA9_9BACL|nr:serine hydrolase [Paenibacillus terricola]MBD3920606.1 serine hydrolase [Paenibacillus terricola]
MANRTRRMRIRLAALAAVLLITTISAGCSQSGDSEPEHSTAAAKETASSGTLPGVSALLQAQGVKDDFWQASTPSAEGMDEALLAGIQDEVDKHHERLYSLMIVRHGKVVLEQYYHGRTAQDQAGVFSVSKSILSALTGIAIRDGIFTGVEQDVGSLLPDEQRGEMQAPLQLKQLLTMSGGLKPVDDTIMDWFNSSNWVDFVLQEPSMEKPGIVFRYNTGLSHLLSAALTHASGESTISYAEKHLLGPLGIQDYGWQKDPQGIPAGGTMVTLRPRDMARFGYLYLHNGEWIGRQLVPKDWVAASTKEQIKTDSGGSYGYFFWLGESKTKDGVAHPNFAATGYGDQLVLVVPELDLVAVATSNPDSRDTSSAGELIDRYVIPAIMQ